MKYLLEISDMQGDGLGEEEYSRIESDTSIPIPNKGDEIDLTGVGMVEVINRVFRFYPAIDGDGQTAHIQVFCKKIKENS